MIRFATALLLTAAAIAARKDAPSFEAAPISIDYPAKDSIFPPDISRPTFLWRDSSAAIRWRVQIAFGDRTRPIEATPAAELMRVGEIDATCVGSATPQLTPEQAASHTWAPDAAIWEALKKHSVKQPATITITGFTDTAFQSAVSRGQVTIQTSKDPVGAPVFYRDVPLIPVETQRGVIQPLPKGSIPLIKWRLRYLNETESRTVLHNVPTCINCHSFSRDGKTLGLDVDGPQNDKGLYGLVPVAKRTVIAQENVIHWAKFSESPVIKRFGFMSQISPDGQYVITSIENPGKDATGIDQRFYNAGYMDYRFGQVFYPTRGVLAWYSRQSGTLKPLPGADDPRYVQASAFWTADGKYLVFSRTEARDPYREGQRDSEFANSPDETQIQYDLYRIPFNEGKGGTPERIEGASQNGYSNNFPKVSPDGKWIVYVRCKTGLLMRPDSRLYIVPFQGGTAREMRCNTPMMNSWHSFSPNGRWLVFSSKSRTPFTQMFLTHIDEDGNDSPPILIENATAANRAVNIPEFANIPPGAMDTIDPQATEFYRLFDVAYELGKKGEYASAIPEWQKAVALSPDDPKAEFNLGVALGSVGRFEDAVQHYRKAVELEPGYADAQSNLGVALMRAGRQEEGIAWLEKAVALNPASAKARANLGAALTESGRVNEGIAHLRTALQADPHDADAHANLAIALLKIGQLDEAIPHFETAIASSPDSFSLHYNLARALLSKGRLNEALPHLEAVAAGGSEPAILGLLAAVYAQMGRLQDASQAAHRGLDLAKQQGKRDLVDAFTANIAQYEAGILHP